MLKEELFRKKILLHAPDNVSEVILFARYIPMVSQLATEVSLKMSDANGLAEFIQSVFTSVVVFTSDSCHPFQHDIELDLVKLPSLFNSERYQAPVSYLRLAPDTVAKFNSIMEKTGMTNIGLALYGSSENALINSMAIAQNITMSQRHKTQFFFIPAEPAQKVKSPPFSHFKNAAGMVNNYSDLAALLGSLDIIIGFENDAVRIAIALGKPVCLMVPHDYEINDIYTSDAAQNVTIFRQSHSCDWNEVIRNISLFRFFQPENPFFEPFTTENMILDQPAALPLPVITFESTNQLPQILDVDLAFFTSVSIETTTVCNLKCSYCPHSTDVAKPPVYMSDEVFFRIIDSLYDYAPSYCGTITPSIYGEPLLDKRIVPFIRYAKNRFPLARIVFFTNGDFLTPEIFYSLREAGVDHYNISQHTPNRSQALSDTLETVTRELGEGLPITFNKMLEQAKFNRGGLVDVEVSQELYARQPYCQAAYQNLSFDYKGDAILCCNDYQAKHTYGNISSKSVKEIWTDKAYRQARNMLMLGFLPFPICRVCMHH